MATKYSPDTYRKNSIDSIDRVKGLATGATLELNRNQCQFLSQALQVVAKFLRREDVKHLILGCSKSTRQSKALLYLYSVVKRAENLVQQHCRRKSKDSWPKRALTLFALEDDVVDILVHLQWWRSILSMLINVPESKLSIPKRVEAANEKFEMGLKSNDELQKAAEKDKKQLQDNVEVELQAYSDHGSSPKQHDANYFHLLQVGALLRGREHSNSNLNNYKPVDHILNDPELGRGSGGVVDKVTWWDYGCAIKKADIKDADSNQQADYDIEAKSLKGFHHPHIVRFFRHWKNQKGDVKKSYILMERMEKDLKRHIDSKVLRNRQSRPFSEPVAIDMMLQVVNAMSHMHNKDVVHRDLKPKNVLLRLRSESGLRELNDLGYVQVKLGDFGLAKADMMTSNVGGLTKNTGTTLYRAPEISSEKYIESGSRNFPRKMDIWSFGIICSEILTGQVPYDGREGNAVLKHVKEGGRPSIPDNCPDYLKVCLESSWKYEPDKRPSSFDMWRMLRVAQLRSLGFIDKNYDLFTFLDHNKNTVAPESRDRGHHNDSTLVDKFLAASRWFLRKQNIL